MTLIISNNLPPLSIYLHLVDKKDQEFFKLYCQWFMLLAKRGTKDSKNKEKKFNLLYKAVSKNWKEGLLLGSLQKEFIKRNLSLSLLLEPLDGFIWLSKNNYALNLSTSLSILLQLIAPFSRFIAVINNQKPTFYQPFSNLIYIYMAIYANHTPSINKIFKNNQIEIDNKALFEQLPKLQEEASEVLSVTYGLKNKLRFAFFVGLSRVIIKKNIHKIKNNMKKIDYVNAFLYGLCYLLKTKDKTKGLENI